MKYLLYLIYLFEWHCSHSGKGFRGCSPASFNEWIDCEFTEMTEHPEWYTGHWYSWILRCYYER